MHSIVFNIILPQFEITLILKAQSDKTPVINLLVSNRITQKPFTLHLSLGIPCVYRGFRG